MPMIGKLHKRGGARPQYDAMGMAKLLSSGNIWGGAADQIDLVVIEKQQTMPKQGIVSAFVLGYGAGLWEGICVALGIRYVIVRPRTWQTRMHRDISGDDPKEKSILVCQRLYPDVDLRRTERCRTYDDNKADSILIACYGLSELANY
jgi:hypothetical protein